MTEINHCFIISMYRFSIYFTFALKMDTISFCVYLRQSWLVSSSISLCRNFHSYHHTSSGITALEIPFIAAGLFITVLLGIIVRWMEEDCHCCSLVMIETFNTIISFHVYLIIINHYCQSSEPPPHISLSLSLSFMVLQLSE